MKLNRMRLLNFRCYEDIDIQFHPRLTVFIGANGSGKTALLDAIAVGFGQYLTKLPKVNGLTSKEADLRVIDQERKALFLFARWSVTHTVNDEQNTFQWEHIRKRDSAVKNPDIADRLAADVKTASTPHQGIGDLTDKLIQAHNEKKHFSLPVIAYYGTNRAIREEVKRRNKFDFSRFEALAGALDPNSHFRGTFEWFKLMEEEEWRAKEARKDFDYRLPELEVVRQAMSRILGKGFSNPRSKNRPLRFVIDKTLDDGSTQTLRISQLSDGYRVMLGVVMDFARRLAQANPQSETNPVNPLDTPGIMLIDEIDLHLHPSWQQRVIHDLMNTFAQTQFIVTTHSPQVLSTVHNACIQVIEEDSNGRLTTNHPQLPTYGERSGNVLLGAMRVEPTPPLAETPLLQRLITLVDQGLGQTPEATQHMTELEQSLGPQHSTLQQLRRTIERQNLLRSLGA